MASHKRKRSSSVAGSHSFHSSQSHLPSDSINPLSYSESSIKQLAVAGLTENDHIPSSFIPGFPHRPYRAPLVDEEEPALLKKHSDDDDDVNDAAAEEETGITTEAERKMARARQLATQRKRNAQDQHLGFLTAVVLRGLEEGDVVRAKRAFGLLRRSEVQGRPVDLRRNGLWALGAEILMRDGEVRWSHGDGDEQGGDDDDEGMKRNGDARRRWGFAANVPNVRTYLEGLIRQYPYNRMHPDSISAIDFWPVMLGIEFYNVYIEQKLALERLEAEADNWDDDMNLDMGGLPVPPLYEDDGNSRDEELPLSGRDRRLRQEKVRIGLIALAEMRQIAARMDNLMDNEPYSKNVELLRLRGMVALYVGDLTLPPSPRSSNEDEEGQRSRSDERDRARIMFTRMRDNGGQLDRFTEDLIDPDRSMDDGDEDWQLPVFSSQPFSSLPFEVAPEYAFT